MREMKYRTNPLNSPFQNCTRTKRRNDRERWTIKPNPSHCCSKITPIIRATLVGDSWHKGHPRWLSSVKLVPVATVLIDETWLVENWIGPMRWLFTMLKWKDTVGKSIHGIMRQNLTCSSFRRQLQWANIFELWTNDDTPNSSLKVSKSFENDITLFVLKESGHAIVKEALTCKRFQQPGADGATFWRRQEGIFGFNSSIAK